MISFSPHLVWWFIVILFFCESCTTCGIVTDSWHLSSRVRKLEAFLSDVSIKGGGGRQVGHCLSRTMELKEAGKGLLHVAKCTNLTEPGKTQRRSHKYSNQ